MSLAREQGEVPSPRAGSVSAEMPLAHENATCRAYDRTQRSGVLTAGGTKGYSPGGGAEALRRRRRHPLSFTIREFLLP